MTANKWKAEKVKLKDANPSKYNPRQISDEALSGLKESLRRFGYVEPIVWNKTTGNIVGGHQRYSVLVDEGVEEATMIVVEMSAEEELAANLSLNNPKIQGEWDDPILGLLEEVKDSDDGLFEALNMDDLVSSVEAELSQTNKGQKADTKCPCCGHAWSLGPDDVKVEIPDE